MAERKNEAKWIENRGRWQINVQNDGKRRTFTSSIPGKKGKIEAEKKADKWLTENTQNENIRFEKLYNRFLEEVTKTKSKSCINQHEQNGRLYILPLIGHKKVTAINIQNYQDCIYAAYKKGLSKKTCQNIRSSLSALYSYARKNKIPLTKPEFLEIPNDAPVKEKRILQPNQLKMVFSEKTVIKNGKEREFFYIYAIRLILVLGLRRGELCGLQKTDIAEGNILTINRSVNRFNEITQGKNKNAKRVMILPEIAIAILEEQEAMLKREGIISKWLFPDEEGFMTVPNRLGREWEFYRNQKGTKCTLHELRHTMISLQKNNMPEQLLKQVVGHSKSMDTFGVYGHEVDGEKEEAAQIINMTIQKLIN
ncbi:MAG: tyrosine-type recombinase/integrase [Peptococcaceae bacterium]|nr:tyrosine-type recombinase/integrase [Peptococcaceae bacterium]